MRAHADDVSGRVGGIDCMFQLGTFHTAAVHEQREETLLRLEFESLSSFTIFTKNNVCNHYQIKIELFKFQVQKQERSKNRKFQ